MTIHIMYVHGPEGNSLYINNYRVSGPKPWGGGTTIAEWNISYTDFKRALRGLVITRKPRKIGK